MTVSAGIREMTIDTMLYASVSEKSFSTVPLTRVTCRCQDLGEAVFETVKKFRDHVEADLTCIIEK